MPELIKRAFGGGFMLSGQAGALTPLPPKASFYKFWYLICIYIYITS